MLAKEIIAAIRELEAAGWRVVVGGGHAHAYAKAYCPGGARGCRPVFVIGTPRVPDLEAAKMRGALKNCEHGTLTERR